LSGDSEWDKESSLPDSPLETETGVGGMWEGFSTDEALALGLAEVVSDFAP
jgi:hypothetical protein